MITFYSVAEFCFYFGSFVHFYYSLNIERTKPFAEWSVDAVCAWFEEMGLAIYEDELRKWLKNGGADLMNVSSLDIEKEINLKSALHRKKIILALMDITGRDTDELFVNSGKLDTVWVCQFKFS